jgi:hypothetical protein
MGIQAIVDEAEHAHLFGDVAALWIAIALLGVFTQRRVAHNSNQGGRQNENRSLKLELLGRLKF